MALNRDKFRGIVGGITTPTIKKDQPATVEDEVTAPEPTPEGQGTPAPDIGDEAEESPAEGTRRFAMRGRPKASKAKPSAEKAKKVKVSLFLNEVMVNDFYDWAHADRMHPGEMFERALKPFHERESKRRKGGKE